MLDVARLVQFFYDVVKHFSFFFLSAVGRIPVIVGIMVTAIVWGSGTERDGNCSWKSFLVWSLMLFVWLVS